MSDTVPFTDARPGDESFVYTGQAVTDMEFGWVSDLDYFDEREHEVKLRRQRWRLISEDVIVLPDPYPVEDDEDDEDIVETPIAPV